MVDPKRKLKPKYKTLLFDIETNGLLKTLTRVHCLVIREYETGRLWVFRHNKREDTIRKGLEMLMDCEVAVGHNIYQFDLPAIEKVYPWFETDALIRDTLVMTRHIFSDVKDKDFRLWERGKLPGKLIGLHTLDAWGYRVGLNKGDYAKQREQEAKDKGITDKDEITYYVWGTWNQDMEDYCENDVDVTAKIWTKILDENYPEGPIRFEHMIHALACKMEDNGFPFDKKRAIKMSDDLEYEVDELSTRAINHYGRWYAPDKKRVTGPLWEGQKVDKVYPKPRPQYGEDTTRKVWAEITIPKQTRTPKSVWKKLPKQEKFVLNPGTIAGAPFCKVKIKEFNPGSRPMIIDRFTTVHDWEPNSFTEKGNPEVNDEVLTNLIGKIPMAKELSEIFYLNKRLGQVKTGNAAWLKMVDDDGAIHNRTNTGGTISGRCSHSSPNIAQVPSVKSAPILIDGENDEKIYNPKILGPDGEPLWYCYDKAGELKKKVMLRGRLGNHGWDCRRLFYVPPGWKLIGTDLSGIELRCLANLAAPYDNGFLIKQILEGDIHTANQEAAGLETRDQAKTFIYALIYGAGDEKIGSIVEPLSSPEKQRQIGKRLKTQFFRKLPGLAAAVKQIQRECRKGWIEGLDGRRLRVRAKHAALNLRLQSDGAVVAKEWALIAEDRFLAEGLTHGWDGDFAFLAFVHDELQVAVRDHLVDFAMENMPDSALEAGENYKFRIPTEAESKVGINWAETH